MTGVIWAIEVFADCRVAILMLRAERYVNVVVGVANGTGKRG
jgi:hypothetical protein